MDIRRITEDVSVSPQILPEHLPDIATSGFKSVICNRPDEEDPGQPRFADVAEAAKAVGIEARLMPVVSRDDCAEGAAGFARLLDELPKPVLAYCRSGTRCAVLWALSQQGSKPVPEIVEAAGEAGYDLRGMFGAG
ncbi:MAG: TIGR01244 family sulfur transferase [Pseudomonadota bacterium]